MRSRAGRCGRRLRVAACAGQPPPACCRPAAQHHRRHTDTYVCHPTPPPGTHSPRFSWNKSQLEKARNEGRTQTNPLATALRGVVSGLPTALLVVASITRLDNTTYNK